MSPPRRWRKDSEGLFQTIRALRDRGVSVIFISHRLSEIFEVADRVTVMRDGRRVFTRDTAATTPDELVRAMVGEDLKARLGRTGRALPDGNRGSPPHRRRPAT